MATMFYDGDADIELIRRRKVAVIGYGSQGHAHALNLQDSGVDVVVGLQAGSRSAEKARSAGLRVLPVGEAAAWADVIMILIPDQHQARVYTADIAAHLTKGKMLMFAHGFAIRFDWIVPPADVDVTMVAPKAPGHRVREVFTEGAGTPGLLAVHQDVTGKGRATALSYARAIGCTRAGVIETTFAEETETDLFGEQAVLCGGTSALVKAGFETLIEAGYQPEIAYFECLHELKLIVDPLTRGGLQNPRHSTSATAEDGDHTAGTRIDTDETRATMRQTLKEIQTGEFARKWITENEQGCPNFNALRERDRSHPIEVVGARLRPMMPFLDPVQLPQPTTT
jgi:ketol-acid reductoisomerase